MSGFKTFGGILNIAQIIAVILNHVQDHTSIKEVLEKAATRGEKSTRVLNVYTALRT